MNACPELEFHNVDFRGRDKLVAAMARYGGF
jgi:hypothetical protein